MKRVTSGQNTTTRYLKMLLGNISVAEPLPENTNLKCWIVSVGIFLISLFSQGIVQVGLGSLVH